MFHRYLIACFVTLFMFLSIQASNASYVPDIRFVSLEIGDAINKHTPSETTIKAYDVCGRYRVRKSRGRALKYRQKS